MTMSKNKTLTLVEGRKVNYRTINDMRAQTAETGWGFLLLEEVDRESIARCDFGKYFSKYVIWRDLNNSVNAVDVMRIYAWLNKHKEIHTINTHMVGGRAFSSDKYYQHSLYGMDPVIGKNTPITYLVKDKAEVQELVRNGLIRYPLVLKERFGTAGKGIVLVPDEDYLLSEHIKGGTWPNVMAEPYIFGDYDWRVFVVGGVAVGMMRKELDENRPGDFVQKSAGKNKTNETDPEVRKELSRIACRMASVCGLEYAGCDIIRDKRTGRYYVLETNNSAGWQNHFNDITGLNMGRILLSWFDDMSVLDEKGFFEGVKAYTMNRANYLYENKERFEQILDWKEKTKEAVGNTLAARLQRAYLEILNGAEIESAKGIIEEVENTPLCWAGNFISSNVHGEGGIFEEDCIPTAYYLAIREKYDKILGVK